MQQHAYTPNSVYILIMQQRRSDGNQQPLFTKFGKIGYQIRITRVRNSAERMKKSTEKNEKSTELGAEEQFRTRINLKQQNRVYSLTNNRLYCYKSTESVLL